MTDQAFIDFLVGLAPDGETPLLVLQKPELLAGALQHHADGAVKCTWPASLPTRKRKEGEAWYANTASFVKEKFEKGRPRATRDFADFVLVMVLDDVGTKSKTPPLPPTWVMETSPGSFQWGYAFDEQPTKEDFAAAIKAIAAAGYTDPGSINPVRNFRIPGSVNLKPGRGGFVSRLVEFHPKRLFTLEGICAALSVTPDYTETGVMRALRVEDDGADVVMHWLIEHGMLLNHANDAGWCEVTCPNAAKHSDGNPAARYKPADRGFVCYHSSCVDLTSVAYLDWVAEHGGPKVSGGLREELLVERLSATLKKLAPTSAAGVDARDQAEAYLAAIEKREKGRLEKTQWGHRFAYIESDDCYFDLDDRTTVSRPAFNALYRHVTCKSIHGGRRIEASVWFDENREELAAKALKGLTYAPGEGPVVAHESGTTFGNRWLDGRPVIKAARGTDAGPWLRHCEALIPDKREREHVLDAMAFKLQHPTRKINHAVLHMGDEGCGKDTLWAPFIRAVCGPQFRNRALVNGDQINSPWGYALESEILILNELHEPEAAQRRALANRLKPLIAAPPDTLTVNRKMMHPYDALNRLFVIAFSNEPVPISLASQDRRWFMIRTDAPRMSEIDAMQLWNWYDRGGYDAVAAYLRDRDVVRFNPAAPPMMTEAKRGVLEDGMSMMESWILEQVEGGRGEFSRGIVAAPFHSLLDRLQGQAPQGKKVYMEALLHAMKTAGWRDMGKLHSREYPSPKRIWASPALADTPKTTLRRMVEDMRGGSVVALSLVPRDTKQQPQSPG